MVTRALKHFRPQRQIIRSKHVGAQFLSRGETFTDRCAGSLDRALREQSTAAEHVRLDHQREALLARQYLGSFGALQRDFRLTAEQVKNCRIKIRHVETERMREPLSKIQRSVDTDQRLVGITEKPIRPGADISRADPGIVATVQKRKRPMPLEIVETAAFIAMAAGCRRVAYIKARKPGGMMSFQA